MPVRLSVIQPETCCEVPVQPKPLAAADQAAMLAVFKALSDPTRFEVFRLIAAQPEAICACDVVDRFAVSQPTIAHHLRVLREAGLVTVSRRGVWAYYAADRAGVSRLREAADLLAAPAVELAGIGT